MRVPQSIKYIADNGILDFPATAENTKLSGYSNPGTLVGSVENFIVKTNTDSIRTVHYQSEKETDILVNDLEKLRELIAGASVSSPRGPREGGVGTSAPILWNTESFSSKFGVGSNVAVVTFDACLATMGGGITSAPRYEVKSLLEYGNEQINYHMVSVVTSRSRPYDDEISKNFEQRHWSSVDFSEFDYVFIAYPASMWMRNRPDIVTKLLSSIKNKFGLIIHDEYELDERFKNVIQVYFDSPKLDMVQYIAPRTREMWRSYYDIPESIKEFITPCYPPGLENVDFSNASNKQMKLVNTARIVSRKKIVQLLNMIPHLEIPSEVYGALQPGIYVPQLENCPAWETHYKGRYPDGTYPSRDAWFTWGVVLINRGYNVNFAPRVELGVIEALRYGTIPILLAESLPEELRDFPTVFSWRHELGNIALDFSSRAKILNDKLRPVINMTDEERLNLAKSYLDRILKYTNVSAVYKEISASISESCQGS